MDRWLGLESQSYIGQLPRKSHTTQLPNNYPLPNSVLAHDDVQRSCPNHTLTLTIHSFCALVTYSPRIPPLAPPQIAKPS